METFRLCRDPGQGCMFFLPGPLRLDSLNGGRDSLRYRQQARKKGGIAEVEIYDPANNIQAALVMNKEMSFDNGAPAIKVITRIFPNLQQRNQEVALIIVIASKKSNTMSITYQNVTYTGIIEKWKGKLTVRDPNQSVVATLLGRGGIVNIEANTTVLPMNIIAGIAVYTIL